MNKIFEYYQKSFGLILLQYFFLSLVFIFITNVSFAQSAVTVKGKITDETGGGMPSATVKVKGTTTTTVSDNNGNYSIGVPGKTSVLVFSFVNYKTQEITIGEKTTISVQLAPASNELEQVVVVGYGTQKKTSLTAAVSTIKGDKVANLPVANLSNTFGGRAPGLIVTQGSGEPGQDGASLLIRGIGTTGGTAPLVIVDGVPRTLGQLDPQSVESITFLKDAAAVAPYGVAGANGVILVTTKRGNTGKPELSYNASYGLQNPTHLPEMVDAFEYVTMRNAAAKNAGTALPYSAADIEKFRTGSDPDVFPNHDVLGELINKDAPMMSHNLSVSGGTEKIKYFGSLGYLSQDGMWGPTSFKRYNLTSNVDAQVTSTTKFSLSLSGRVEDKRYPGKSAASIFDQLYRTPPVAPVTFSNGLPGSYIGRSAYGNIYQSGYSNDLRQILTTQVSVEQQLPFVKGLSVKGVISYDYNDPNGRTVKTWLTPIPYYSVNTSTIPYTYPQAGSDGPAKPSYNIDFAQSQALTYQGFLNYNRSFGKHDFGATLVSEYRNTKETTFGAGRSNFNVAIPELSNGSSELTDRSNYGSSSEGRQYGLVFRATYAYAGKYLAEISGRYDGNYVFAPGSRYHLFPAASIGWRLSEEKFIKDNYGWIDNLKIRASYGESGALPYIGGVLAPFQYLSAYALYGNSFIFNGGSTQGLSETAPGNPNITWETANKTNIGLDLSVFKGLFDFEFNYFRENRSNMLIANQTLVPSEFGIGLPQTNAAAMQNRGFDLSLGSHYAFKNGMRVGLTGNFTYAKNKLVQVFENASTLNNPNRSITGKSLGTKFGYHALGLFQQSDDKNGDGTISPSEYPVAQFGTLKPGDIKYEDVNGDNKIDNEDIKVIGNSNVPQIIYGFSPEFSYKGFDVNILFQGAAKADAYLDGQASYPFFNGGSALKATLDYWTPENTNASYPRVLPSPSSNSTQTSDFWIRSGNYLRMKSVTIGYTVPSQIVSAIKLKSIRLYLSGQNLVTWTKGLKDFDPEISASNANYYPQQKVYTFGLNVTL
ncbi:SusC/RagA family TonB-linked outer membrane protein [Pedobacter sp. P26]|uniref:SusC/RagA family TonB-linked outer membrane protein n=1 Tax=Pedobacter sp. P26 TaxID=3423956 RepID=UPI003D67989D